MLERCRECYRGFFVVIIGELFGYELYYKFILIDRVVFWYKVCNEFDFFEVVEN